MILAELVIYMFCVSVPPNAFTCTCLVNEMHDNFEAIFQWPDADYSTRIFTLFSIWVTEHLSFSSWVGPIAFILQPFDVSLIFL